MAIGKWTKGMVYGVYHAMNKHSLNIKYGRKQEEDDLIHKPKCNDIQAFEWHDSLQNELLKAHQSLNQYSTCLSLSLMCSIHSMSSLASS